MRSLLVLAAGRLQMPAIEQAKLLGLRVIAADGDPNAPGLDAADVACVFDIRDVSLCVNCARTHKVHGVIQICSEVSMIAWGRINEQLGLKGINSRVAVLATNKHEMRMAFRNCGVPSPKSILYSSCEEAERAVKEIGFPVICKPSRSSGSRGIARLTQCDSQASCQDAFELALAESRDASALIEEYVDGPEFSVEILILGGQPHVLAVTDKVTTGPPHFVETGHSQPTRLNVADRRSVIDASLAGVRSLGIDWSAAHAEVRLGPNGPVVIEIGARLGGDFITTELVPRSTGINMVRAAIQVALGEHPDLGRSHVPKGACIRYLQPSVGIVSSIEGVMEAKSMDGVRVVEVSVALGDRVGECTSSTARVGHVIAEGRDAEDAIRNAEAARESIRIRTVPG